MYHRAQAGPDGNSPVMLDAHFAHLVRHCNCVLPGERLSGERLNVCLTFDDAYFDFYSIVFPLLQKHDLRAVLAVPPALIGEHAGFPDVTRTNVYGAVGRGDVDQHWHCTWGELATLAASGRVAIAAHGLSHSRLDRRDADLEAEILLPREELSGRLGQSVDSFVFPFGRFSPAALHMAQKLYRHVFRIGGAMNRSWSRSVLYRVNGDGMNAPDDLLCPSRLAAFRARFYWNRLRGR
jgi:peptidoglycan/xylan/chitin deacetylase (PgdA/CDA1 family)